MVAKRVMTSLFFVSVAWSSMAVGQSEQELIYSVNRTPEGVYETPRGAEVITIDEIWRKNARNLPELLMREAGIFVQQSSYGGGSPIIRGLIGKHILILVDGVKLNSATYSFGPIQFLNTIDINSVERVEIVRGVGATLSSAMGGIINVITKKGPRPGEQAAIGVAAFSRYGSADEAVTGHAEVFGRTAKARYIGGFTYRRTDDLAGGTGIGVQPRAAYDELSGNAFVEYNLGDFTTLSGSYRIMEQDSVPGADFYFGGLPVGISSAALRMQQGWLRL